MLTKLKINISDTSENQCHRANFCPQNCRDWQVDTENHSLPGHSQETEFPWEPVLGWENLNWNLQIARGLLWTNLRNLKKNKETKNLGGAVLKCSPNFWKLLTSMKEIQVLTVKVGEEPMLLTEGEKKWPFKNTSREFYSS